MKPPSLEALQHAFQTSMLSEKNMLETSVKSPKAMTKKSRIQIYKSSFYERITRALQQDFPLLFAIIGEAGFESLVVDYVSAFPPRHYSLRYAGENLSHFIRQKEIALSAFADLAALEWAWCHAQFYQSLPRISLSDLSQLLENDGAQECVFTAHPCAYYIKTEYSIRSLWDAFQATKKAGEIKKMADHDVFLIWSGIDGPVRYSLNNHEEIFFQLLQKQLPFEQVCIALADSGADDLTWVGKTLHTWVKEGLFVKA